MATYFITAIDTDAGKTFVTGLLGKYLKEQQHDVITMKLSQTGCNAISEDIEAHRRLMGIDLLPEDRKGLTCPYVFKFPASPHLAAEMEGMQIQEAQLDRAIASIEQQYNMILLEGVGGLMVPINHDLMLVDYVQKHNFPIILVTSGRLGSINHTLLTLEVMKSRRLPLYGVIYNHYPITAPEITVDSAKILKQSVACYFPKALWGEVPVVDNEKNEIELHLNEWFNE